MPRRRIVPPAPRLAGIAEHGHAAGPAHECLLKIDDRRPGEGRLIDARNGRSDFLGALLTGGGHHDIGQRHGRPLELEGDRHHAAGGDADHLLRRLVAEILRPHRHAPRLHARDRELALRTHQGTLVRGRNGDLCADQGGARALLDHRTGDRAGGLLRRERRRHGQQGQRGYAPASECHQPHESSSFRFHHGLPRSEDHKKTRAASGRTSDFVGPSSSPAPRRRGADPLRPPSVPSHA